MCNVTAKSVILKKDADLMTKPIYTWVSQLRLENNILLPGVGVLMKDAIKLHV